MGGRDRGLYKYIGFRGARELEKGRSVKEPFNFGAQEELRQMKKEAPGTLLVEGKGFFWP